MGNRRTIATRVVALLSLALAWSAGTASGAPPTERVPGTIQIQGSPHGLDPYVVVEAFPNLVFDRPVWIGAPGDGSDNLFVAEQDGVVKVFENRRETSKAAVALDIRKQVLRSHDEEGLLGMAFHPQFKKNRQVYVAYSAGEPRRFVLSRFEASSTRKHIRASSEEILLRQRQPFGNHNGGGLAFGPDGYLYVSLGDGGSHGDPEGHGQNLNTWLGAILRIDVSGKRGYAVPADNPFADVPHTQGEIWAYGLQNPRRFSFDRVTGDLWAGDVSNAQWQEIHLIKRGGNYGWNLRDGKVAFKEGRSLVNLEDPVLAIGSENARRITGGHVYRGKRLPGLVGAYVYGDAATGGVWALRLEGREVKENLQIGRGRGVSSFGEDADGESLFTSYDGKVYTLVPWTGHQPKGRFPQRLSDTGLYTDMLTLKPHPSLVPYSVNVPLWSDGAHKQRYVMLPGLEKVAVQEDGRFEFPVGTIFVQTFYQGQAARGPVVGSRLETRLFLRGERDWVGYTYVWDDGQGDAYLIDGRLEQPRLVTPGAAGAGRWTFPSRADCMSCHTEVAGRVLGFRQEQLDRTHDYDGEPANQLEVLARLGVFDKPLRASVEAWPDWEDPQGRDVDAVRAYLDANCAMCHQPDGPGNALIDLRFGTRMQDMNLLGRGPGQWDMGIYGARLIAPGDPEKSLLHARMLRTDAKGMPPLAHNMSDAVAVERVANWIRGLK